MPTPLKSWNTGDQANASDVNGNFILTDYFGDGSDGALNVTSGTTTLSFASASYLEKNYSSVNVSVGATLAFSNPHANGSVAVIRTYGACTIAGTLNLSAMGAAGGAGGVDGSNPAQGRTGNNGNNGNDSCQPTATSLAGNFGKGGNANADDLGGTGGAQVAAMGTGFYQYFFKIGNRLRSGLAGAGGGGGGAGGNTNGNYGSNTTMGDGGNGGAGGGGLILLVGGNCTLSGTLNLSGVTGSNGTNGTSTDVGGGGGGGGGAGGRGVVIYRGTLSDTSTKTVSGGGAGTGGSNYNSGTWQTSGIGGGGGSGGASVINNSTAGNTGTVSSTLGVKTGADGGAGAAGEIEVVAFYSGV